jgi:RNA-directed DNA polymerase
MQKSYESGSATHIGPESCEAARKGGVEALTGERERAGRVYSRERIFLRDADAVRRSGRPHRVRRYREACQSPARSETPCTHADTSRGNREIPSPPRAAVAVGRIGKSKDVRR